MTTYRAIAATETDPQAPITSALMKALQDNVRAMFEGDATASAERLQFAALGSWYTTTGAIGTYAMLRFVPTVGSQAAGTTHAGSGLRYSSSFLNDGGAPAGTWRLMGAIDSGGATAASLFVRIS